jgi:hypothetical protein
MKEIDAQGQFAEFFRNARRYVESPGVTSGLELDESTVRLRQVALVNLQDPDPGRCVEKVLGAVRHQDTERVRALSDEIAERAGQHAIAPG